MVVTLKGGEIVRVANQEKLVTIKVRGYTVYVEDKDGNLYTTFIATDKHQLAQKDAKQYIHEGEKLIALKLDKRTYKLYLSDIIDMFELYAKDSNNEH